jgi:hypothetical protein
MAGSPIIHVPSASDTDAHGINDAGQIVGLFFDHGGLHGFVATPVSEVPEPGTGLILRFLGFDNRRVDTAQPPLFLGVRPVPELARPVQVGRTEGQEAPVRLSLPGGEHQ